MISSVLLHGFFLVLLRVDSVTALSNTSDVTGVVFVEASANVVESDTYHSVIPPARANRTSSSGAWVQHLGGADVSHLGFVVGVDYTPDWKVVQFADGDENFDWKAVDAQLTQLTQQGFFVETALQVGPASPTWLYDKVGVQKVDIVGSQRAGVYPYYLDQKYQVRFLAAVDAYAAHLATLPDAVKSRIAAVQAMYGTTGDDSPWHGKPKDSQFIINKTAWHNFTMSTAPAICKSYTSRGFHVLWNTDIEFLEVLVKECPGSFIKAGMVSHSYQTNYEADDFLEKGTICHTEGYHCRGETWPFCQAGFYKEAPVWATYWHILWQLTFGVDLVGFSGVNLANDMYTPYYELYNRHAPAVRPPASSWHGGIIALRDGLDSSDTVRFPVQSFGNADIKNQERVRKIVQHYAARNAAVGDMKGATSNAFRSRSRTSMNDVGWRIWSTNMGVHVTQLLPDDTSIGWWRVGPKDQPYGRFARSFEQSSGKTAMGFVLDERLWGGLPLTKPISLQIRMVHYNDHGGSFEVRYDALSGACKTAKSVKVGTTGRWDETIIDISDARFAKECSFGKHTGAHIAIVNTGDSDVKLHGFEILELDDQWSDKTFLV